MDMTIIAHADQRPRMGRDDFDRIAPAVIAALQALGQAVENSGLDKSLTELVKLRASQINRCAFCIQYHLNVARRSGVSAVKLDLVSAWREAGVYSTRERAALAWTEALTFMAVQDVSEAAYVELQAQFDETEIAFLTAAVGTINAWNRIAGALHFDPPIQSGHSAPRVSR